MSKAIGFREPSNEAVVRVGRERSEGRHLLVERIEPEAEETGPERVGGLGRLEFASPDLVEHAAHAEGGGVLFELGESRPLVEATTVTGTSRRPCLEFGQGGLVQDDLGGDFGVRIEEVRGHALPGLVEGPPRHSRTAAVRRRVSREPRDR